MTLERFECECDDCRSGCERRPGFPTPDDVERLFDAGLASQLMLDFWSRRDEPHILVLVPAIVGSEGNRAPAWPVGRCTFYDGSRCQVHAIKPTECATTGCVAARQHGRETHDACRKAIVEAWDTERGRSLIERWRAVTGCNETPGENVTPLEVLQMMFGAFDEIRGRLERSEKHEDP